MTDIQKPASVADTLRAARALIEDPKRWIKGQMAKPTKRSADWKGMEPTDVAAGAWCAAGAIKRVDGPYEGAALIVLVEVIEGSGNRYVYGPQAAQNDIIDFNDTKHRRHKDVLAKFDAAIELAEKAPVPA